MVENKILLNVDEKIAYNCLIFTKSAYRSYLEIKLNDKAFLESISNDSYQNQLSDLEWIEKEFSISLENGKNYLNKLIQEQGNKEKLEEYENTIEALNSEFHNERSGDKIKSINDKIDGIYDDVISIDKEGLSDELYQKLSGIINRCKTIKDELKAFLDTFVSDDEYEKMVKNRFNKSRLWQNTYGNYSFNPYLNSENGKEDENIQYVELTECAYLPRQKYQNPLSKIFVPLSFGEFLFFSKDAKSITCINSKKEVVFTHSMNDYIVSSGSIMFFKDEYYLIIPCKNSVKIVSEKGVIESFSYGYSIDDTMIVKSITIFNHMAYILIDDIINNQTLVDFIQYDFYQKQFKNTKQLRIKSRILSNIFIMKDEEKDHHCAGYIDSNKKVHVVDLESFDSLSSFDVDITPIDGICSLIIQGRLFEFMYNYPVISKEGYLYYLGYSKKDELFLNIINPFNEADKTQILMPVYQRKANRYGFLQSFTNIAVSRDKVFVSGIQDMEICEISLDDKMKQVRRSIKEHRSYNFLIAYDDYRYVMNRSVGDGLSPNNASAIVSIWNGHLICREPRKESYILYIGS